MPSSHLILCCPFLLLPQISPSIRAFSDESTLHMRWPKYWSYNFSISPSKGQTRLISFRMDWLDLLADLGSLKSLLSEVQEKELRMAEGEEGMVRCKQNLPSNPLIREGFLDRGLLDCWQTDPKIDSICPVVYLQDFSSTEFITF